MPLYRIHKFVYDIEQSCWKMPQMPRCLCIHYSSFFVYGSILLSNVRIVQWWFSMRRRWKINIIMIGCPWVGNSGLLKTCFLVWKLSAKCAAVRFLSSTPPHLHTSSPFLLFIQNFHCFSLASWCKHLFHLLLQFIPIDMLWHQWVHKSVLIT